MSAAVHAGTPPARSRRCVTCQGGGPLLAVRMVEAASGPGGVAYACPIHAATYLSGEEIWDLRVAHVVVCATGCQSGAPCARGRALQVAHDVARGVPAQPAP